MEGTIMHFYLIWRSELVIFIHLSIAFILLLLCDASTRRNITFIFVLTMCARGLFLVELRYCGDIENRVLGLFRSQLLRA
jgi:hypothetical protein